MGTQSTQAHSVLLRSNSLFTPRTSSGGVSLTMRHRMQCTIVTEQSVALRNADECPVEEGGAPKTIFLLPGEKWNKKQKVSTGMLVSAVTL